MDLLRRGNGGCSSSWDGDPAGRDKGGVDQGGGLHVRGEADGRRVHEEVHEERRAEEARRQPDDSVHRGYGFLPSLGPWTVWGSWVVRTSSAVSLSWPHTLDGCVVFSHFIDMFVLSNLVYGRYSLDYP